MAINTIATPRATSIDWMRRVGCTAEIMVSFWLGRYGRRLLVRGAGRTPFNDVLRVIGAETEVAGTEGVRVVGAGIRKGGHDVVGGSGVDGTGCGPRLICPGDPDHEGVVGAENKCAVGGVDIPVEGKSVACAIVGRAVGVRVVALHVI